MLMYPKWKHSSSKENPHSTLTKTICEILKHLQHLVKVPCSVPVNLLITYLTMKSISGFIYPTQNTNKNDKLNDFDDDDWLFII